MPNNRFLCGILKLVFKLSAFLLIICLPIKIWSQTIETVIDFPILKGNIKLRGVVSQPKNLQPNSPLLVLVSPPQPINRDYGGLYKALSDSLNKNGFITFRYDNRNYSDTTLITPNEGRYTMHDAADDLHDALLYLKMDKRFSNHPIGIIGHSEGGNCAIIEASRNSDVKLLLLLATAGITGEKFVYTQSTSKLDFLFEKLTSHQGNLLKYSIYYPVHILATNSNNKRAFSNLKEDAVRFYNNNYKNNQVFFGNVSQNEYVEDILSKWTKSPRELAFIRYNPAIYFPSIKCPIFLAYAKYDNKLRYNENKDALECILMNNRIFDYKSIVIDSVNHNFEDTEESLPIYVSVSKKNKGLVFGKGFSVLCKNIVEWIEEKRN